jgi:hypothetical protein
MILHNSGGFFFDITIYFNYIFFMQKRAITGNEFEKTLQTDQWIKREVKPKMKWSGKGRNVFNKIESVGYDVTKFNLSEESVISKSDFVFHSDDSMTFEAKKYLMSKFKNWVMYSEPFFKVSTVKHLDLVDVDKYNKFVDDFMTHRQDIIERVLNEMSQSNLGIRCIDGFISQDKLEFKAVKEKSAWMGYHRITIMVKMK